MISDLWRMFPRLIERNIDGLLDRSEPNALRQLQIYRRLRVEGLCRDSVPNFQRNIETFFSRPRAERRKSQFDAFLDRPMDAEIYSLFQLDFRTAAVPEGAIRDLASWAHNLIRVSKQTTGAFASLDVMFKTLLKVTSPSRYDKAHDIDFGDFCSAWKRTVFSLFGHQQDAEFDGVLRELRWLDAELKREEREFGGASGDQRTRGVETALVPGVYLTQTEIDWTIAVRRAATENSELPEFPLSRGPEKPALKDLARVCSLYTAARVSRLPEIVRNKERIRATLLDRCDSLLGRETKLSG